MEQAWGEVNNEKQKEQFTLICLSIFNESINAMHAKFLFSAVV